MGDPDLRTRPVDPPDPCDVFAEHVAELAAGLIDEPQRTELLEHAATCASCRAELDQLTLVVDRLLVLAPEAEPPAGFETRALAAMRVPVPDGEEPRVRTRGRLLVAAAALVLIGVVGAVGWQVGRSSAPTDRRAVALDRAGVTSVRSGTLTDTTGRRAGSVLATSGVNPVLVMTLEDAEPGARYRCSVVTADGTRHEVGTWSPRAGVASWSVTLGAGLASVREVVLTDVDDVDTATAHLSAA